MKYKTRYDLSHITSMDALKKEQIIVKLRLKEREEEIKMRMYEIPAELAAAGAQTLIPKILRGKITEAALSGGKRLINNFLVPSGSKQQNTLTYTIKKPGVLSLLKKGFSLMKGR